MKWPIPSEAKFSPLFQQVSPCTEPAHSFFQIFIAILWAFSLEILSAARFTEQLKELASKKGSSFFTVNQFAQFVSESIEIY